jgi:hypothetical protein
VRFYDRLVQPLLDHGVTVLMADNVGHAEEAKHRAKGVSAKQDRADVALSCARHTNPVGLVIRVQKVRSVRTGFQYGDEWLFERDTQRIERRERTAADQASGFRPTNIMEKVSRTVEQKPGLSKSAIRAAVGGKAENVDLALELLIAEGYIEAQRHGQAHRHESAKPYREADDPSTESTESQPSPDQVPDSVSDTESHRVPHHPVGVGGRGLGSGPSGPGDQVPLPDDTLSADNGHPPAQSEPSSATHAQARDSEPLADEAAERWGAAP